MKQIFLIFILSFSAQSYCQNEISHPILDSVALCENIDNYSDAFFIHKEIPAAYEYSIKQALTYFPELEGKHVEFRFTKISTTLNARPTIGSLLFQPKLHRKYIVRINTNTIDSMVTLNEVPFNAQIGLFGHELCHFVDYQERDLFQVISRLFSYTSKRKKAIFEKEIDTKTIERGLGWELYDWSSFVLNDSDASETYKAFKRRTYLTPEEIVALINIYVK